MNIFYNFYDIAFLKLNFSKQHLLKSIEFVEKADVNKPHTYHKNHEYFIKILDNYFSAKKYEVDFDLLDTNGISKFYIDVYKALLEIPLGMMTTYKELAINSGHTGAYRAVGSAMARNRWPILIPCHRVKAVNSIGGYSSGIELKKKLIASEEKFAQKLN
ncbi:methylated-DNA--[protein]-cysteine S-methyltransferase [Deferribacteraceae bacterium V6Fe1]|nr:methylated-DNA--[protein]-cysteine S-methyltransferase [Deferribacteraceae bacterium V6Fe1]